MKKYGILLWSVTLVSLWGCAVDQPALTADAQAPMEKEIKYVALTFDDGPRRSTTTELLDGLRERGACATFFLVGEQIEGNEDLLKRMAAEGHQVGNHTWDHTRLKGSSAEKVAAEVEKTDKKLREILGEGEYWLRPPYGQLDEAQKTWIPVPMVQWSVDSRDWESKNTEKIVAKVLKEVKPNSIILLHDIYPTSVEAALQIVDALQAEGYWFVTVRELLALNGIQPQAGVLYRSGDIAA